MSDDNNMCDVPMSNQVKPSGSSDVPKILTPELFQDILGKELAKINQAMDKGFVELRESFHREVADIKARVVAMEGRLDGHYEKLKKELATTDKELKSIANRLDNTNMKVQSIDAGRNDDARTIDSKLQEQSGEIANFQDKVSALCTKEPLEDIDQCVVAAGMPLEADNSPIDDAKEIVECLNLTFDVNVVGAKRLPHKGQGVPLLKFALATKDEKITVLRNKKDLSESGNESMNRVFLRTSKTQEQRVLEHNTRMLLKEVGAGGLTGIWLITVC